MAQMRDHWDQVVGVENAKHSYPASLRDGVLTIRCDSPAWTTTLSYMTPVADGHHPQETRRSDHQ